MESVFNPDNQNKNLDKKIVIALERVSEAFKVLLWERSKAYGLSPIQIQVLIFIQHHSPETSKVGYLSDEFNVTKATISDTIKTLEKKEFIFKEQDVSDQRSYQILLTSKGKELVQKLTPYPSILEESIKRRTAEEKEVFYNSLLSLIHHLNISGIISIKRMCFSCKFLLKNENGFYCNFLEKPLAKHELRIDCPEHIEIL